MDSRETSTERALAGGGLRAVRREHGLRVRVGGLAIWSADSSAALLATLTQVFGDVVEEALQVQLGRRLTTYHLFVAEVD